MEKTVFSIFEDLHNNNIEQKKNAPVLILPFECVLENTEIKAFFFYRRMLNVPKSLLIKLQKCRLIFFGAQTEASVWRVQSCPCSSECDFTLAAHQDLLSSGLAAPGDTRCCSSL